jgi:hypothetical protein
MIHGDSVMSFTVHIYSTTIFTPLNVARALHHALEEEFQVSCVLENLGDFESSKNKKNGFVIRCTNTELEYTYYDKMSAFANGFMRAAYGIPANRR